MNTRDEAFLPQDCAQSQNAQEAWLALTSHRHLMELSRERARLAQGHARLHILEALSNPEEWDELHTEVLEGVTQCEEWIARGKAAIWS